MHLSLTISKRYERGGSLVDLECAMEYCLEAIAATGPGILGRVAGFSRLGDLFSKKYERFETPGDLDQAIKWTEEALEAAPDDFPERDICICNLGRLMLERYQKNSAPRTSLGRVS